MIKKEIIKIIKCGRVQNIGLFFSFGGFHVYQIYGNTRKAELEFKQEMTKRDNLKPQKGVNNIVDNGKAYINLMTTKVHRPLSLNFNKQQALYPIIS
ncbi:hypothetical protein [Neobacillus vireti]|uniref:hypothetical protein n=1 Tax=Neobacillus vireti TaxID=220686 RepID=UPI002FFF288C